MAELVADRAHVARSSLIDWIGRTPLVRLRRFETRAGVELYAKLEMKNPGGSVKDRAARAMMLDGDGPRFIGIRRSRSSPTRAPVNRFGSRPRFSRRSGIAPVHS